MATVFCCLNFYIDVDYCCVFSLTLSLFQKMYQTLETKTNYIRQLLMQNVTNVFLNSLGHFREMSNAEMEMSFAERSNNILKILIIV